QDAFNKAWLGGATAQGVAPGPPTWSGASGGRAVGAPSAGLFLGRDARQQSPPRFARQREGSAAGQGSLAERKFRRGAGAGKKGRWPRQGGAGKMPASPRSGTAGPARNGSCPVTS